MLGTVYKIRRKAEDDFAEKATPRFTDDGRVLERGTVPRLLDPVSTAAIILGASDWTSAGLGSAPSFQRSATDYHSYLLSPAPHGLGLQPDLVLNLFDDPSPPGPQLVRVRDTVWSFICKGKKAGQPITDLLIYYIGYGSYRGRHLYLLVRASSEGTKAQSSIGVWSLANILHWVAPQQRQLVVLECYFTQAGAAALNGTAKLDEAVAVRAFKDLEPGAPSLERGTLLLCSSSKGRMSMGPPQAQQTLFTGALLSVLKKGSASRRSEMLSFSDLVDDVYDRMRREYDDGDVPHPALRQLDQQAADLTRLPAFPNAAWARRQTEEERQEAEARCHARQERQADEVQRKFEAWRPSLKAVRDRERTERYPCTVVRRPAVIVSGIMAGIVLLGLGLGRVFAPPADPPVVVRLLTVAANSAATPIEIPEPIDPNYPAAQLNVVVTGLPSNGTVVRGDRTTAVNIGETLTAAQLTALMFVPSPGAFDQRSAFSYSVKSPAGLSALTSATLAIGPNRTPPATEKAEASVAAGAGGTSIGIPAPSDPNYPAVQLSITVTGLPSNGKVVRADRTTAVNAGEALTAAQLTELMFIPRRDAFDQSSTFSYSVQNPAGLAASGSATLAIGPNQTPPGTEKREVLVAPWQRRAEPMGVRAPSDHNYPAAQLSITVTGLPSNGKVVRADRVTAVNVGETLTVAELTELMFVPKPGAFDRSSALSYSVKNPAGLSAFGYASLTIGPKLHR
jgi:hypothetical protein